MSHSHPISWINVFVTYFLLRTLLTTVVVYVVNDNSVSFPSVLWSVLPLVPVVFRHRMVYLIWGAVYMLLTAYFLLAVSGGIAKYGAPNNFSVAATTGVVSVLVLDLVFSLAIFYTGYRMALRKPVVA